MHSFMLQDWVTIRGGTSQLSVEQGEDGWLDLEPYQDVVIWLLASEVTGPTSGGLPLYIDFQTAPVRDETFFLSMVGAPGVQISTGAPIVTSAVKDFAPVPLARWVRWVVNTNNVTPNQVWDVTMRIYVAANFRSGGRALRRSTPGSPLPRAQGVSGGYTLAQATGAPTRANAAGSPYSPAYNVSTNGTLATRSS